MAKIITLGEIMLRFSTKEGERLGTANTLATHFGGGEANVAVSLANFGHEVYFATKIPENALGQGVLHHLKSYGVLTNYVLGGGNRLGTYYVESGIGERASQVLYDRADSSFAQMKKNEWENQAMFDDKDIFHISGITPALTPEWQTLTLELVKVAKKKGCQISFDVNYRSKLWTQNKAKAFLQYLLPEIDYCSAGKLDALYLLDIPRTDCSDKEELINYYQEIQKKYPNIKCLYSTKREVISATENLLTGTLWVKENYVESVTHHLQPIVDRVGAGDAFTAGVLHGLLTYDVPQKIIDFATASAALKHTVYGDVNLFTEKDVLTFIENDSSKIVR
ncbi:sugar kinase [Enterococcus villorum]|uniref:2-dehydro-3-deoxygluconokinase n=2 Tax=Enterococcus villorum TaxID=112904 RepID=A0A511J358_9ENTE|nr:sugar kinase [Enterococcus villorum]EOH86130.1 hypothetical protein UAO_02515 [Enterococcus villorum ATCC 700913]EOW78796.1 hypothetical protein I591_00339 [Enterococcus villorum ATCC 700913]GEL92430.1 2-dehydro-3-deoxygluconokinase [Enterococcus villorum]